MTAPGLREGVFDGIVINGQPATNFDYVRTIVEADAEEAEQNNYGGKKNGVHKPFKSSTMDPKIPTKAFKDKV